MLSLKGKVPIISIILPFKNEAQYLGDCVDSILNQTIGNWELILVDDHSTDDSTNIAKDYAKHDARIRYFLNPNSGVIEALKHGFNQSTGSLITRMDGDDIKTPDNLEQLQAVVSPGTLAIGKVLYFRSDGLGSGYQQYQDWINQCTGTNNSFSQVYKECVVPSPCWLAYRDDFVRAGGFDSDLYPEDYDLCFRFYAAGLKTRGTTGVIHHWRDHPTRTTRISPHYSDNRFMQLKLHYFSAIDYDNSRRLVLWGAGKKGKMIAKYWVDQGYAFDWVTDNSNKIGHNIYGVILQSSNQVQLSEQNQVVVAVADKLGQAEISQHVETSSADVYWFC